MPRLPPGLAPARERHGETAPQLVVGWCLPCYEAGAFTLASDRTRSECTIHRGGAATVSGGPASIPSRPPRRTPSQGRAGRTLPALSRPPTLRRTAQPVAHHAPARVMAYGRRRAAARLSAGTFQPHPGWRNFIDPGWRVLIDQAEALRCVEELVDAQGWRRDKRTSWLRILRRLVYSMDWSTGLVTAVTAQRLGEAGERATRTVSRVLAWARDTGLVVVVEHAASAEFLGTDHGRTPTYALVTNTPLARHPSSSGTPEEQNPSEANREFMLPVDENGDLPTSCVDIKPLNNERLTPAHERRSLWLVFRIPESTDERNLATQCFLQRLGLDRGGVSQVPLWRTRALLRPWWDAGASPAGLLHAIDHHPDHPDHHRGSSLRGAHDPLRVLGHHLRPWHNRLGELPITVRGIRGDYRQHEPAARRTQESQSHSPPVKINGKTQTEARHAARAALDAHLRLLRERRATRADMPIVRPDAC